MAAPRRALEGLDPLAGAVPPGLVGLALAAGLIGGGAAIAFREVLAAISRLFYGLEIERMASATQALPWWWVPLVLCLGGLGLGLWVRWLLPGARPHGVAEVIDERYGGERLTLGRGVKAALAAAATLGLGGSAGREGPVVHLGASLGGWLSERFKVPYPWRRTLLAGGVAAAVAASFNAPLAGSFFALEVVLGRYAFSAFAPVALAAVAGTLLSHLRYGAVPAFVVPPDWKIASLWELPAFIALGVLAALLALLFTRAVFWAERGFRLTRLPPWARPMLAGLVVGLLSLLDPRILGVGYEATSTVLANGIALHALLLLLGLKLLATALTLGGGFVGGVFSPALFLGAALGGAIGQMLALAGWVTLTDPGAYALVGMGAVAGAVLGAPVSTIVMMVEFTGDFALTIAVASAAVVASLLARRLGLRSFFHAVLTRRGAAQSDSR